LRPRPEIDLEQHHDNGNHQQDVDDASHCIAADQTEQPENEQYYGNGV